MSEYLEGFELWWELHFYDGILSGIGLYKDKVCFFDASADSPDVMSDHCRIYNVYEMPDHLVVKELIDQQKFLRGHRFSVEEIGPGDHIDELTLIGQITEDSVMESRNTSKQNKPC